MSTDGLPGLRAKPKAVAAMVIAFLIPFLTAIANQRDVTWRSVLIAVVAALVANESIYQLPHSRQ